MKREQDCIILYSAASSHLVGISLPRSSAGYEFMIVKGSIIVLYFSLEAVVFLRNIRVDYNDISRISAPIPARLEDQ
ncbi:hypothetical protein V8C42DRAFT_327105 [Trichoderma barbatum]